MKKLIIALWLGYALGAMAQDQTLTIKPVKEGEEPQAVMNAIKTDFPQSVQKGLGYLPGRLFGSEWNVTREGEQLENMTFFEVKIKQGNTNYTAVYDKDGKLLSSMQIVDPAKMPPQVQATVKKFSGWHVDTSSEQIKYNGKTTTDVYKIKLQKGAEHKIVFVDPAGNIINTRFAII